MNPVRAQSQNESAAAGDAKTDPSLEFAAEETLYRKDTAAGEPTAAPQARPAPAIPQRDQVRAHARSFWRRPWTIGVALTLTIAAFVASTYPYWSRVAAAEPRFARVTIETEPSGAQVLIDGSPRGETPITMSLAAGAHTAIVRQGSDERTLPLTLAAGADLVHHLELRGQPSRVATGGISIVTDPPGARVELDGVAQGVSPMTLSDLAPANYSIRVSTPAGLAQRTVKVTPGAAASVMFSLPKNASPAAGWLLVSSPFDVQILDDGVVVGAGKNVKILLSAGKHSLLLANEQLQYRNNRSIDVAAGATATLPIEPPTAVVNVNARPWADVVMNGKDIGQTPIANLTLPIGTYEVLFRHPQLGSRRATVQVRAVGPNRISMDLTN